MIDEKKLIEFIKSNDFKRRIIQSKDSIQDILVQFITEQQKVGEWIPCSERLPKEPKTNPVLEGKNLELYLVTTEHGSNEQDKVYPFRAFWNGVNFTDGWHILDVVAWMPLPEPYKGE